MFHLETDFTNIIQDIHSTLKDTHWSISLRADHVSNYLHACLIKWKVWFLCEPIFLPTAQGKVEYEKHCINLEVISHSLFLSHLISSRVLSFDWIGLKSMGCEKKNMIGDAFLLYRNHLCAHTYSIQFLMFCMSNENYSENELKSIQTELRKTLKRPRAAGLLRLVFHDAGTFNIKTNTGYNLFIVFDIS